MTLKNVDAEKCAQEIAKCINDKVKRQTLFSEFLASHPDLKHWEGLAIGSRALEIYKESLDV